MGNDNDSIVYEANKLNIIVCGNILSNINKQIIKSLFEKEPENYEFKKEIDLIESQEYLYFSGEILKGEISNALMEEIKKKIKSDKNIVICFSDDTEKINIVKDGLLSLIPVSIIPFMIFVKNNSFSQDLKKLEKLSKISIIEYFGNSKKDVNKENTRKTCEIFRSKIFQIDGYLNERGTIFYNYSFELLNKVKGEVKKNLKTNDFIPGNRSILNIFLFGEPSSGKSRFINLSMDNLIARENCSSCHVTKKFTKYALPMSSDETIELGEISLFDSPGLTEDRDVIKEFKNMVNETLKLFQENKKNSPILLYFIKRGDGISQTTLNFLNYLDNKKCNIFFVITHSKKDSEQTNNYRNEIIHQLKSNNTFTDKNLKMLNNNGENIIAVNLKEDSEIGEFYGFRDIYKEISKLFPDKYKDLYKEVNNLNDLKQQLGFIFYKYYFY